MEWLVGIASHVINLKKWFNILWSKISPEKPIKITPQTSFLDIDFSKTGKKFYDEFAKRLDFDCSVNFQNCDPDLISELTIKFHLKSIAPKENKIEKYFISKGLKFNKSHQRVTLKLKDRAMFFDLYKKNKLKRENIIHKETYPLPIPDGIITYIVFEAMLNHKAYTTSQKDIDDIFNQISIKLSDINIDFKGRFKDGRYIEQSYIIKPECIANILKI